MSVPLRAPERGVGSYVGLLIAASRPRFPVSAYMMNRTASPPHPRFRRPIHCAVNKLTNATSPMSRAVQVNSVVLRTSQVCQPRFQPLALASAMRCESTGFAFPKLSAGSRDLFPTVPVEILSFGFVPQQPRLPHSSQPCPGRGPSRLERPRERHQRLIDVRLRRRPGSAITLRRAPTEIGNRHACFLSRRPI
jgi:hypothetical protein